MLKSLKKSYKIILFVFLLVLLFALVFVGFNLLKEYSFQKSQKYEPNNNEIVFKNYVYQLPNGWRRNERYSETYPDVLSIYFAGYIDEVSTRLGAIISVHDFSLENDKDEAFNNVSFFKEKLENSKFTGTIGKGKIEQIKDTSVVLFPCEYGESSKVIFAYMPAYENHYYQIQFYANKLQDDNEEMYYDYDELYVIINFLSSRVFLDNK